MSDASGSGTIYRIAPSGFQSNIPKFDLSSDAGRISALMSPAVNVRALGFKAIRERLPESFASISSLLDHENSFYVARAIWLLPYAGDVGMEKLWSLLDHKDPQIRITAFRAMRRALNQVDDPAVVESSLADARKKLVADPSSAVRREVALSLRDVEFGQCRDLLVALAKGYDGWDRWYLEALGTACDGKEREAYELLVGDATSAPEEWDRPTAGIAWRLHPTAAIDALTTRAMSAEIPTPERKRMMNGLAFIQDRRAAENMLALATTGPEDLRGLAAWWGKSRDTNDWKAFGLGDQFPEPPPVSNSKKNATRPQLQFALPSNALFQSDGGDVEIDIDITDANRLYLVCDSVEAEPITAVWVNPVLTTDDSSVSLASIDWAMAFSGSQTSYFLDPANKPKWERPKTLPQPKVFADLPGKQDSQSIEVNARSGIAYDIAGKGFTRLRVRGAASDPERKSAIRFAVYADFSPTGDKIPGSPVLATMESDATLGRALFLSDRLGCAKCHMAEGFGGEIGPDLTQIANKHAPPVLFEGILRPSAAIATGFETMTVLTVDGQVLNGLMISAGDPVVLKDANGKIHSTAQEDIEQMRSGQVSIMPELKEQLTAQEVASLVAYLQDMARQEE
ncbi:MAG: hypothetical protein ACR2NZ_09360, partial [Rubripirellula sp.]